MALTVQIILRVPWFRGSCDSMLQQSSLAMPWHFSFISEIQLIRGTCANSRASVKCNLAPKQQRQKRTSAKKGHRFLQASNAPRSACKPLPCKRFLTFRWWIPVDIGGSLTMEPWGSNVAIFKGKSTGKPHISWENRWFPVDFPLNQSIEKNIAGHLHIVILTSLKKCKHQSMSVFVVPQKYGMGLPWFHWFLDVPSNVGKAMP